MLFIRNEEVTQQSIKRRGIRRDKMTSSSVAFFVIRNSTNQNCNDDEHRLIRNGSKDSSSSSSSSSSEYDDYNNEQYPPTLSIVRLVETSQGKYMLDSSSNYNDTFMSTFLAQNHVFNDGEEEEEEEERIYIDERVWQQLIEYSVLVDKPLSYPLEDEEDRLNQNLLHLQTSANNNNTQHHNGPLIQLTNNTKEVIHTLLSIDNLFKWQTLITARSNNQLQWKDIRYFLKHVRNNIPFLTHDGYLKHVVNTHLTFHQFVCFSKLIDEHLECQLSMNDNNDELLLNIDISDIFPLFDSLTLEEQKVELLACVKDKAVRISAQSCDVVIPTVPTSADDNLTNNDEWNIYMKWWSSITKIRSEFCMRELLYAEKDTNVRRNAQKNGNVSLRGRHSKNLTLREEYLRRFGCWYYGIEQDEKVRDDGSLVEDEKNENVNPTTTIYTYDFETGQNSTNPTTDQIDSSNHLQMPNFHNKSWKPSSSVVVIDQDDHETVRETSALSQLMTIGSTTADNAIERPVFCSDSTSISESVNEEEPQHHPREEDRESPISTTPTTIISNDKNQTMEDEPLLVCSKIKPAQKKKPVSFRRRFLSRVTMDIDNVASMVNKKKKDGDKLSGIELFRSKVRLIIMLKRFLGIDMRMIEAVAPQNVDIFSIKVASPPPPRLKTPEEPQSVKLDPRNAKELLAKAKSHYKKVLCRKVINKLASWVRLMQIEKQRKEQQRLAEQERLQQLFAKATQLYQRSLMIRLFRALRLHAVHQKEERAKAVVPEPVVEVVEEEPPIVEQKYTEDQETKHNIGESNGNCNCMELVVGRSNRKSSLDVLLWREYNQQYAHGIELSRGTSPRSVTEECGGLELIDHATMRKMKRDKLAGASNLFDVPEEFVYGAASSQLDDGFNYVEYRTREMSKKTWRALS